MTERHLRVMFVLLVLASLWGMVAWRFVHPATELFGTLAWLVLGLTVLRHAGVE